MNVILHWELSIIILLLFMNASKIISQPQSRICINLFIKKVRVVVKKVVPVVRKIAASPALKAVVSIFPRARGAMDLLSGVTSIKLPGKIASVVKRLAPVAKKVAPVARLVAPKMVRKVEAVIKTGTSLLSASLIAFNRSQVQPRIPEPKSVAGVVRREGEVRAVRKRKKLTIKRYKDYGGMFAYMRGA